MLVNAIYESGQLRLLEEVNLIEGQRVQVDIQTIEDELTLLKRLLGDRIQWADPTLDPHPEVEALADEIDRAFQGNPPLSEIIIQERGE